VYTNKESSAISVQMSTTVTSYSKASLTVFISKFVWFTRWLALRNTYCFLHKHTAKMSCQVKYY